jgi:hypothetical protein
MEIRAEMVPCSFRLEAQDAAVRIHKPRRLGTGELFLLRIKMESD